MEHPPDNVPNQAKWQRWLWILGGVLALIAGIVGIVLPLLPTVPFVLLAAWCFSRGSARYERWMLTHPYFGPMVREWRASHALPLRAKQLASITLVLSSVLAWYLLPPNTRWLPGAVCALVAIWLWRLPTRPTSS